MSLKFGKRKVKLAAFWWTFGTTGCINEDQLMFEAACYFWCKFTSCVDHSTCRSWSIRRAEQIKQNGKLQRGDGKWKDENVGTETLLSVCLFVCLSAYSFLFGDSIRFYKTFLSIFFFIHFSFFLYVASLFQPFSPLSFSLFEFIIDCCVAFGRFLFPFEFGCLIAAGRNRNWLDVRFFFGFVYLFSFLFFCCPSRFGNLATLKIGFGDYFFCWRIFARFNRWSQIVRFIRANFKWIGVQFFSQWPKIGFKWDFGLDFKVSSQKIGENLVILSTISKPFVYFWWTFSSFSVGFQLIGRKLVLNDIFC